MAARIDNGRVQLLTRTGLDWTDKYPSAIAALANLNIKTAYIDGELCGMDQTGLPTFAHTQAATDGERNVELVYYAFDLSHLDGWGVSGLQLIERKALLEPLLANKPGLQFNGHEAGDGQGSSSGDAHGSSLGSLLGVSGGGGVDLCYMDVRYRAGAGMEPTGWDILGVCAKCRPPWSRGRRASWG